MGGNAERGFEFLEHPADIQLRAWGKSVSQIFVEAARGMTAYMFGSDVFNERPSAQETLTLEARNREQLLVDWLSKLLYLSHTTRRAYTSFDFVLFSEATLSAHVGSCSARMGEDIKAVTYHELLIDEKDDKVVVTVTFDV